MTKYRPISDDEINDLANKAYFKIIKELEDLEDLEVNNSNSLNTIQDKTIKTTSLRHQEFKQKPLASSVQKPLSIFLNI